MKLFTTNTCPDCVRIDKLLRNAGLPVDTMDLSTPEALTDLRTMGIFELSAPILVFKENPVQYIDRETLLELSDENLLAIISS